MSQRALLEIAQYCVCGGRYFTPCSTIAKGRNSTINQNTPRSRKSGPSVSTCKSIHNQRGRFQFLSSYDKSPWYEVTLEEFEKYALDRLRILAEIESSFARNRSWEELKTVTMRQLKDYLPLNSNSALTVDTRTERRNDHLGHFVLRLAFCRSCVMFLISTSRVVINFKGRI